MLAVGALVVISAVIAGFVIFAGSEPAPEPEAAPPVRATGDAVVVGKSSAPAKVVVYEDFASPESRAFEMASRDFLRIEAGRGQVLVEYRPFLATPGGFGADALQAWSGVLGAATPKQALAFHDVLFDRQPASGSPTPSELVTWAEDKGIRDEKVHAAMAQPDDSFVSTAGRAARGAGADHTPYVVLDGTPVSGDSPVALADALQRRLLQLAH
jgi:protein-disulfide isomerase